MKIYEFFKDNNGNLSSTRLAFLIWAIGVLGVWMYVSIKLGSLQPLDNSQTMILAILMTGKVAQKFTEKEDTSVKDKTVK